jgi:hypothetical protein
MFQKEPRNPSIAPTRSSTKRLTKYLITGLTFIFIYYFWPSSVPYGMDRMTLLKPSIGISLTASYGYGAIYLGGNEITLTNTSQDYIPSSLRRFIRGPWSHRR